MDKRLKPAPPPDPDAEDRILEAAHMVFVRRGTGGARMQEIADEAGVNKALLHYYFRSKDRLAAAVFDRVAAGMFGRVAEIGQSDLALPDKVRGIVETYLDQFAATPYVPAYLIGELAQHPERAEQLLRALAATRSANGGPSFLAKLASQIDQAVKAKRMRPITPQQFLTNLVSLCIFPFAAAPMVRAIFRLDERGFAKFIAERKTTVPEFFLNALRP